MSRTKLAKQLKNLVDFKLNVDTFPIQSGSRINIGSYSIKPVKDGWSVLNYKNNEIVATTYTKAAALAIAKNLAKNKDIKKQVLSLDELIAKHHIDCMFYANTMKNTTSYERYETICYRYQISKQIETDARDKIKSYIL